MKQFVFILGCLFVTFFNSCIGGNSQESDKAIENTEIPKSVFTAIGDVPYNAIQKENFIALIAKHNTTAKSDFVIHVGDIKPGGDPCNESVYAEVSGLLKRFTTPTFIVLGDNEFNDCTNPINALGLWNTYFLKLNTNWSFKPVVNYQPNRQENFSFIKDKVLFIGLNLVGSSIHDLEEWNSRLTDNSNYVQELFTSNKDKVSAVVVFGHANMVNLGPEKFATFTTAFRAAAATLQKPVLYLQGDGHFWMQDAPWPEKNIMRVQIEGGATAVEVTIDPNKPMPFSFNRSFLN